MKKRLIFFGLMVAMGNTPVAAASKRMVTNAVEAALRQGGRQSVEPAARRAAMAAGEQVARRHGAGGLRLLADGGMDAVQVMARYGDDAVRLSNNLSPAARRVMVSHADSLIPIGRRLGAEAVERAAKSPHTAAQLLRTHGDDLGMRVLRQTPPGDLPRVLRYLDAADSPATREAFLRAYRREGASIFQRIPPGLVVATGLSTAMVVGTVRATQPMMEVAGKISELAPEEVMAQVMDFVKTAHSHNLILFGAILLFLIWRPGRRRKEKPTPAPEVKNVHPPLNTGNPL